MPGPSRRRDGSDDPKFAVSLPQILFGAAAVLTAVAAIITALKA